VSEAEDSTGVTSKPCTSHVKMHSTYAPFRERIFEIRGRRGQCLILCSPNVGQTSYTGETRRSLYQATFITGKSDRCDWFVVLTTKRYCLLGMHVATSHIFVSWGLPHIACPVMW
jgi:hypothetical protein